MKRFTITALLLCILSINIGCKKEYLFENSSSKGELKGHEWVNLGLSV